MSSTPRAAAAALVRKRASAILPRVISDATSGDRQRTDAVELERRLTAYLERRIPLWVQALEADDAERAKAIQRLLRTDAEAGERCRFGREGTAPARRARSAGPLRRDRGASRRPRPAPARARPR